MKTLLALFLFGLTACAQSLGLQNPSFVALLAKTAAAGASDPCTSCTNETYEGVGTSVVGWHYGDNSAGVVTNVDYATAPAPLVGSHSLVCRNPNGGTATTLITIPSSAEVWARWTMVITNTIVNNMEVYIADDNVGTHMMEVQVQASGLRIVCGTANATTVSTLTFGTQYYVWAHYLKGSGANAVADVAFSTTKVRPTSGNGFAQVTTGSRTANVTDIGIFINDISFGSAITGIIFDSHSITQLSQPGDFP